MRKTSFTAILEKEGDVFVALCPKLHVASQGATVEEATANLKEAVELFLECADPVEVETRQHGEVFVTRSAQGAGRPIRRILELAGAVEGPKDLSRRKGFSRP